MRSGRPRSGSTRRPPGRPDRPGPRGPPDPGDSTDRSSGCGPMARRWLRLRDREAGDAAIRLALVVGHDVLDGDLVLGAKRGEQQLDAGVGELAALALQAAPAVVPGRLVVLEPHRAVEQLVARIAGLEDHELRDRCGRGGVGAGRNRDTREHAHQQDRQKAWHRAYRPLLRIANASPSAAGVRGPTMPLRRARRAYKAHPWMS